MALVVIGLMLMMSRLLEMEKVFMYAGVVFFALGLSDMFYINRYKSRLRK